MYLCFLYCHQLSMDAYITMDLHLVLVYLHVENFQGVGGVGMFFRWRGPCLGPVFITSLSNRNQRARGKKEEPFHEDTLMIEDKDRNAPGYGGRSSPIPFTAARQVSYYKKFDAFELDDIM